MFTKLDVRSRRELAGALHRMWPSGSGVLRRLNADVCAAVLADDGIGALIDEVRSSNRLIADVDDHREWFRYHQLLREVLRAELRRRDLPLPRRRSRPGT